MSVLNEVKAIMNRVNKEEDDEVAMEKIEPFSEECKWGKNGLWLFIAPQGGGKTYLLIEIILYAERYLPKPFFNQIIFSSTSDGMDKTLEMFKKEIKTPIEFVPADNIMKRLQMHIRRKKKFYSMMKYINSHGEKVDDIMKKAGKKYHLYTQKKTAKYIKKKIKDYGHPNYPANLFLILDDYLGDDSLERRNQPLVKMLTKLRHYNITTCISQQSTKGIGRTARILASDVCLWKGFGEEDFLDLFKEISLTVNKKDLYKVYSTFKNRHDRLEVHKHMDEIDVQISEA